MKKILLAALATGLISTGAMALDGTVTSVVINTTVVKIGVTPTGLAEVKKNVDASTDLGRVLIAAAMTAKESQAPVAAFHDGVSWNYFEVKSQ